MRNDGERTVRNYDKRRTIRVRVVSNLHSLDSTVYRARITTYPARVCLLRARVIDPDLKRPCT